MPLDIDLDLVRAAPKLKLSLMNTKLNFTLSGWITSEFTISGTANYKNPYESAMDEASTKLNAITATVNSKAGTEIPQIQLKTLAKTVGLYVGSEKPTFDVPMLFVTTKPGDNIVTDLAKLVSLTMPEEDKKTSLIKAPGNYIAAEGAASAGGTWTVSIGSWFRARHLLLLQAQATFSKEVVPSGAPLYANASATFAPYRLVSSSDFRKYFK